MDHEIVILSQTLTHGQKTVIAVEAVSRGESKITAAKDAGVGICAIWRALAVKKYDHEQFDLIKHGELTVKTAYRNVMAKRTMGSGSSRQAKSHPQTTMNAKSIQVFLADLRREITRRRKENHDERMKVRWNPEAIITRFQTELLDWIEEKLDVVTPAVKRRSRPAVQHPHSGTKE